MNSITEPLPGLLDDPQFQISDLPALTEFQIAPLRNPAPTRHGNVPLPLEPGANNILQSSRTTKQNTLAEEHSEKKRAPKITPNDVLLARESKKPHLAISELLEARDGQEIVPTQLPSFVSLSVVEKSPIQAPATLEHPYAQKRPRIDVENESNSLDLIRRLPRPAPKDERQNRPAPMLPAMVTGLHEPPPSAALLPSIDVDSRPGLSRSNTTSKIHVKDILTESAQYTSPAHANPSASQVDQETPTSRQLTGVHTTSLQEAAVPANPKPVFALTASKDSKPRRTRRKWSENETRDLLAGVKKHGIGKWKQILDDPSFEFSDRSSVDLKDRYRVCANNDSFPRTDTGFVKTPPDTETSAFTEGSGAPPDSISPDRGVGTSSLRDSGQSGKPRRKRRAWTTIEDRNLLKGVGKHGFQWTAIHDDPELDLHHRRATDLRDRIRTKYPEGYKHAETAPLKSELKRTDKLGGQTTVPKAAGTGTGKVGIPARSPESSSTSPNHQASSALRSNSNISLHGIAISGLTKRSTSSSSMTMLLHSADKEDHQDREGAKDKDNTRDKSSEKDQQQLLLLQQQQQQQPGVTLPSFTLDVGDNMDWEDNRLPPLHEWEEIGI
ncbi:hypothetical protein KCU88_g6536, partial [Aureobasidium melanogenum]